MPKNRKRENPLTKRDLNIITSEEEEEETAECKRCKMKLMMMKVKSKVRKKDSSWVSAAGDFNVNASDAE